MGLEFTRWTVFSNTIVTVFILVAVIFSPFLRDSESNSRPTRSISVTLKLPAADVPHSENTSVPAFKWSLDPTSAWFLMLPTCLWPALILFANRSCEMSRLHYFLLMVLQSTMNGLFVAHDLISFITFLMLTTFCLLCTIRLWNGSGSRPHFESTMYLQFLGDGFIIGGLLLAATAYTWMQEILLDAAQPLTFQFEQILEGTVSDISLYPLAEAYWSSISPWIFLLLLTGFTIKGALFPIHYGLTQWLTVAPSRLVTKQNAIGWNLILLTLITKISIYGMIRFMVPLNFMIGSNLFPVLAFWGSCGFLIASLIASVRNDLLQIIAWFLIGQVTLTLPILFAADTETVANFILLNVIQGIACCLLLLVIPIMSRQEPGPLNRLLKLVMTVAILTLVGAPGLGGFTAQFALIWSLVQQSILVMMCYLLGSLLFNLALIRAYWQFLKPEQADTLYNEDRQNGIKSESTRLAYLAFAPALLLILLIGVSPMILLEKTSFALREANVHASENSTTQN